MTLRRRGGSAAASASSRRIFRSSHVVAQSARAAALEDPRFSPVRPSELAEIEIELSVLSPMEDIDPERIEAGKHGLMVSRGLAARRAAATGGDGIPLDG